jgi:hypothetical protein
MVRMRVIIWAPVNETLTTGEITPAALTVTVKDDAKFVLQADAADYNGADITGFVNGETEEVLTGTLNITRTNSTENSAGDYPGVLEGSGYSSANYSVSYVPGDYSILPADALLVKLESAKATYATILFIPSAVQDILVRPMSNWWI